MSTATAPTRRKGKHWRNSYEACGIRAAASPEAVARREKPFWIDATQHLQECADIRAEEKRDRIPRWQSSVTRYYGEEGSFAPHDWQKEKIFSMVTPEQLVEIIGPIDLDRLTQRVANLLIDWITHKRHLK